MGTVHARCGRDAGSSITNFREHAKTNLQVSPFNILYQFVAEIARGLLNFAEQIARLGLQMDSLATAIVHGALAFDPVVFFKFP
jgi:hypothetical protein